MLVSVTMKKLFPLLVVILCLLETLPVLAQTKVKGTVVDENGEAVIGVAVFVKGAPASEATMTDIEGKYSIIVHNPQKAVLEFSIVGMQTADIDVKGQTLINVTLRTDTQVLEGVVVTGYQTLSKRELSSAVATVRADQIKLGGAISVDQMLAGQVAGMAVTQTSGSPTATAKIRIRGTSSVIGNKAPLWVLDGVVLSDAVNVDHSDLTGDDAEYLVGNAIQGINPSDIESITILKDASATAIYGVQAANGVIVVTTKKGRSGKASVNYNGNVSVAQREDYSRLSLMDARERIQLSKDIMNAGLHYPRALYTIGFEGLYSKYMYKTITKAEYDRQLNYMIDNNTDWFDILFRNSISQSHSISVSGGNDQTTYYTSVGIDNMQGTARKELTKRYTMSSKLNSWLIEDKLYLGLQINASYSDNDGYNTLAASPRSWAYNTSRAIPCYSEDGSRFYYTPYASVNNTLDDLKRNYLTELEETGNNSKSTSVTAKANITWNILKGLKYELQGSLAYSNNARESYATENSYYVSKIRGWSSDYDVQINSYNWNNSSLPQGGVLSKSENSSLTYNLRNQLTYSRSLEGGHTVSGVGIAEVRSDERDAFSCTYYGYFPERGYVFAPSLTDKYVSSKLSSLVPTKTVSTLNTASFRFIGTYSYKDRYTLNGNVSMDGSNQFGTNPKYRFLPIWSVSGKWNVSEEKFVTNRKLFSYLALRASYGLQGNVDSGTSPDLVLQIGSIDQKTGLPLSTVKYYPNKDLRWEKTQSYNFGLDYSLWLDLISGTLDFYNKKGSDMLMSKTISTVTGMSSMTINAGTLRNTGAESSLKIQPVNTKDWTFYTEIIYSYNKNKLLSANEDKTITYRDKISGNALVVGESLGTLYSYDFAGLNHDTGLPVYRNNKGESTFVKTINGVETTIPYYTIPDTEVGLVKSGNYTPTTTGGINFGFRYRNWRLNANFLYTLGGVARLPSIYNSVYKTFDPEYNVTRDLINRWKEPGDEEKTDIPVLYDDYTYDALYDAGYYKELNGGSRLYGYSMYDYSSARVCKTDNLRMKSVTVSYRLPDKYLRKTALKEATVRLQVTNLFIIADHRWHGCDPEMGSSATSSIPRAATLDFSVRF